MAISLLLPTLSSSSSFRLYYHSCVCLSIERERERRKKKLVSSFFLQAIGGMIVSFFILPFGPSTTTSSLVPSHRYLFKFPLSLSPYLSLFFSKCHSLEVTGGIVRPADSLVSRSTHRLVDSTKSCCGLELLTIVTAVALRQRFGNGPLLLRRRRRWWWPLDYTLSLYSSSSSFGVPVWHVTVCCHFSSPTHRTEIFNFNDSRKWPFRKKKKKPSILGPAWKNVFSYNCYQRQR